MKLSPPASSSDLEAARGIARRLARLAQPGEAREAPMPAFAPNAGVRAAEPPRARAAEAPAQPSKAAAPAAPPKAASPARQPPLQARRPAPPPPPPAEEPLGILTEDEPAGVSTGEEPLGVVDQAPRAEAAIELESDDGGIPLAAPPESHEIDLEDIEGGPKGEPELELVTDFDEEKPAPPSWSDILQDCLFLARARGALLIDPGGKVAASWGEWPPPGVDAIAARLVPAMEKALKNAPARSVSVPLGALHLTAWRVPLPSGVLTVGFVAEGPLKPEVRPTIDAELKRGEPA